MGWRSCSQDPRKIIHDIGRLSVAGASSLIAVNAALEIDIDGQVADREVRR